MKINWKLRFKNKTSLVALVGAILTLVYTVLSMFGLLPTVEQNELLGIAVLVIDLLVMLGIVNDPTTPGVNDSDLANSYDNLGGE